MARKNVNQKQLAYLLSRRPEHPVGGWGDVHIEHEVVPAGSPITVVSMRNAIFMGSRPASIKFDSPFTIRHLVSKEYGKWMSDSPQEVWQMIELLRKMHGRVLVGGLGLGVFPHLLCTANVRYADVHSVSVVERSKDVQNLITPHIDPLMFHYNYDLFDYLKNYFDRDQYDSAFFDIWQATGEMAWAEYIVPLRRLCRGKIKQRDILCWNEEEMTGQLRRGLPHYAVVDEQSIGTGGMPYMECFRTVCRETGVKPTITREHFQNALLGVFELQHESEKHPVINRLLQTYLEPGTSRWEKVFGETWDKLNEGKQS